MKPWLKGGLIGLLVGLIVNLSNYLSPVALWTFKVLLFWIPESSYGGEWGGAYLIVTPASILFYLAFGFFVGAIFYWSKEKYSKTVAFTVLAVLVLPFLVIGTGQAVDLYRISDANCDAVHSSSQSAGCIADYAFEHSNPTICNLARPPNSCYIEFAKKILRLEDCELMHGYVEKKWYSRAVAAVETSLDIDYCKAMVYEKLSILNRDLSYCDKAEQLESPEFNMGYCYGYVALVANKPEMCNMFQTYTKPLDFSVMSDAEMMYALHHDKDTCLAAATSTKTEMCDLWFENENREKCLA